MSKSKEFLELQNKWYKKLKTKGFEDIEQDEDKLTRWDSHYFFDRHTKETAEERTEYYRLAGQFLHEYKFADSTERAIWEAHALGSPSHKTIAPLINKPGYGRNAVWLILKRLREAMFKAYGIKK